MGLLLFSVECGKGDRGTGNANTMFRQVYECIDSVYKTVLSFVK